MIGAFASRAASNDATTVEDEVTFLVVNARSNRSYNGRYGELMLSSILKELNH